MLVKPEAPSPPTSSVDDTEAALAIVEEAIQGIGELLSESEREAARAFALDALAAHPLGRQLLNRVRERAEPDRSGEEGPATEVEADEMSNAMSKKASSDK